jgi:hypothetical protein
MQGQGQRPQSQQSHQSQSQGHWHWGRNDLQKRRASAVASQDARRNRQRAQDRRAVLGQLLGACERENLRRTGRPYVDRYVLAPLRRRRRCDGRCPHFKRNEVDLSGRGVTPGLVFEIAPLLHDARRSHGRRSEVRSLVLARNDLGDAAIRGDGATTCCVPSGRRSRSHGSSGSSGSSGSGSGSSSSGSISISSGSSGRSRTTPPGVDISSPAFTESLSTPLYALGLANMIRHNSSLRNLDLQHCGIGDAGAAALGAALPASIVLTTLHLQHNRITSAGAEALARGVHANRGRVRVNLGGNSGVSKEAIALVRWAGCRRCAWQEAPWGAIAAAWRGFAETNGGYRSRRAARREERREMMALRVGSFCCCFFSFFKKSKFQCESVMQMA